MIFDIKNLQFDLNKIRSWTEVLTLFEILKTANLHNETVSPRSFGLYRPVHFVGEAGQVARFGRETRKSFLRTFPLKSAINVEHKKILYQKNNTGVLVGLWSVSGDRFSQSKHT